MHVEFQRRPTGLQRGAHVQSDPLDSGGASLQNRDPDLLDMAVVAYHVSVGYWISSMIPINNGLRVHPPGLIEALDLDPVRGKRECADTRRGTDTYPFRPVRTEPRVPEDHDLFLTAQTVVLGVAYPGKGERFAEMHGAQAWPAL